VDLIVLSICFPHITIMIFLILLQQLKLSGKFVHNKHQWATAANVFARPIW
jgi:hypothetical protein